jgi:hypothetical protein
MSNPDPTPHRPRPGFLTPREEPPFWRSPEFLRFGALALVALGGAGLFLWSKQAQSQLYEAPAGTGTPAAEDPAQVAARAALVRPTDTLTPEQQAEREAFLATPFEREGASLEALRKLPVEIEGVYYRTATFDSEYTDAQGRRVEATWVMPWIFVRNVRLLEKGQTRASSVLHEHPMAVLAILAFGILGGRLVLWWIQSRRRIRRRAAGPAPRAPTDIRAMFERRLREKGLPPAPPSPPTP